METFRCAVAASVYLGHSGSPFIARAPYAPAPVMEALGAVGALPFLISHDAGLSAEKYMTMTDALVLIGGTYISPELYGAEPGPYVAPAFHPRDFFERDLVLAAKRAGKPVLAFCGGMQIVNCALGGTLYQSIRHDIGADTLQHFQKSPVTQTQHAIRTEDGSVLREILGETARVNSLHNEAIRELGAGLIVTARSEDGIIEGIETTDGRFVGVQWHPEFLWKSDARERKLFEWLAGKA